MTHNVHLMQPLMEVEEPARRNAQLAGQVLSARYRVKQVLHSSAMSHVYEGEDILCGARVAIKVMRDDEPDVRAMCRFFLEARVGRLLANSRYCVRVTDIGLTEHAVPYFVMDYLAGEDLSSYLRRCKRLTAEHAVEVILELCSAVADLHAAGIVHRDIKPSNVFLLKDGSIRLIDFGVCKSSADDLALTTTGTLLGSLPYVPPERWIDPDDARLSGDIWALAVVFYELLSGRLPFRAQGADSLQRCILTEELDVRFDGDDGCPELQTVLLVALHKDPRYRYSTVPEFAAALSRAAFDAGLREEPTWHDSRAASAIEPSAETPADSGLGPSIHERAAPPKQSTADGGSAAPGSRRLPRLAIVAGLLATLGVCVALAAGPFGARSEASPAASGGSSPAVAAHESLPPPAPETALAAQAPPARSVTKAPRVPGEPTGARRVPAPLPTPTRAPTPAVTPALTRPPDPDFPPASASPSATASRPPPPPNKPATALDVTPSDLSHF